MKLGHGQRSVNESTTNERTAQCSVCSEPATDVCPKLHREWIIICPRELRPNDVLLHWDGSIFQVVGFKQVSEEEFLVSTGQGKTLWIWHAELPVLVKRLVPCLWPRCELHCGKCRRYAESEQRREHLLQSANAESQQLAEIAEGSANNRKKRKKAE